MTLHLGLDLGGTNVKGVVLEAGPEPRVVLERTWPTRGELGPAAVVERLGALGNELAAESGGVASAGLGLPGHFDEAGAATLIPNLPGRWRGQPVAGPLQAALGVPVALVNDASAMALAEHGLGAGRGCSPLLSVVVGTGIGGGVVIDGRLLPGLTVGEIGHSTVQADGPRCGCGNRGCVETLASAPAIARSGARSSAEEVFAAARAGDARARAAVDRAGAWLGIAIGNAILLLCPERVVVGGGVAEAGDLFLDPVREEVRRRVLAAPVERIPIVPAALGARAGAIGAALHAAQALSG